VESVVLVGLVSVVVPLDDVATRMPVLKSGHVELDPVNDHV